jgi:hypothetical protein
MVKRGFLDRDMALEVCARNVVALWYRLADVTALFVG